MTHWDAVIIGAGPAGLFCAASVPRGQKVLVLEKNSRPGKKLLISGSGRCNITHAGPVESFLAHYGSGGRFLKHALYSFSNDDLARFFADRGLPLADNGKGKLFPRSERARDVLELLLGETKKNGAVLRQGHGAEKVGRDGDSFLVHAGGEMLRSSVLVIAAGGMSYPVTGSSGDGYGFARSLGHAVTAPRPALVPLYVKEYPFGDLSGISIEDAAISLFRGGRKVKTAGGDMLFTHTSLSGPGILDFSREVMPGDTIGVSMVSRNAIAGLDDAVGAMIAARPGAAVKSALSPLRIPERLLSLLLERAGIARDTRCGSLGRKPLRLLCEYCSCFTMEVERAGGFDEAMVTAGGVALGSVNSRTMESKIVPGLFFAGEVLDIDGDSGGYNLQACFSTAFCAARRMGEIVAERD